MAAASPAPSDPDQPQQVEALIDELILEILDSADQGNPPHGSGIGSSSGIGGIGGGSLLKGVRAGMSKGGSTLERLLLAEALAGVLADALAPALAEALAPRIMKALEGEIEGEGGGHEEPAGARTPAKPPSRSHARKSESK